ncbi:MAG: excinuclease ABC subunit UvrC [Burkholderiales bacterium]|nr:excinuclease ABC subunit UvrC [Burkholderiales bacterium]
MFDAKTLIDSLPQEPGVYRMIDENGQVLYVGKAINLKKRVASYFQKSDLSLRIAKMVSQIAKVETTVTRSEAEALLLENNLIKALSPRYNILFRDDKSYPYLCLTGDTFPQLRFHRGALKPENKYFGPYPGTSAVREGLALLQKVFLLRTCNASVFNNRARPCMAYQIKRCSAPCVGLIDKPMYDKDVRRAVMFLEGKISEIQDTLKKEMEDAATSLAFERAAMLRDQLQRLQYLQSQQFVESDAAKDSDVIAVAREQDHVAVNLVMIRGGRHVGDKTYFPAGALERDDTEVIEAFLMQHYADTPVPSSLMTNVPIHHEVIAEALNTLTHRKINIVTRAVGEKRVWLLMAAKNAKLAIGQKIAQKATQTARLAALRDALGLPDIARIECFDISHTMGEAAVASCVVFDTDQMKTNEYRRFNVTPKHGGDDYAALFEALSRRAARIKSGEIIKPDLWVIDGGKGQLNVAAKVLSEQNLDCALISLGKGVERKVGDEDIWILGRQTPLCLPPQHIGFQLLHQIRDEAHRFAIQGHRARRAKARLTSVLVEIDGIGEKRRRALLAHFGGLKAIRAAGIDDLARAPGISRAIATRIFNALHHAPPEEGA